TVEDHLAGDLVDQVQFAADGDAGVTRRGRVAAAGDRVVPGRRRAVAVRSGELAAGEGPAAEGRGAGRERIASRTDRRGVVGPGIGIRTGGHGIVAVDQRLAVAGGLEVAAGFLRHLGHRVELVQV